MKDAFVLFLLIAMILGIGILFDYFMFRCSGACYEVFSWLKTQSMDSPNRITHEDLKRYKEAKIRHLKASLKKQDLTKKEFDQLSRDLEHCKNCRFCDCETDASRQIEI